MPPTAHGGCTYEHRNTGSVCSERWLGKNSLAAPRNRARISIQYCTWRFGPRFYLPPPEDLLNCILPREDLGGYWVTFIFSFSLSLPLSLCPSFPPSPSLSLSLPPSPSTPSIPPPCPIPPPPPPPFLSRSLGVSSSGFVALIWPYAVDRALETCNQAVCGFILLLPSLELLVFFSVMSWGIFIEFSRAARILWSSPVSSCGTSV